MLIGDAAHAFPPFAGQGAAIAIEDAACLATLFSLAESTEVEKVGRVFEGVRRPRVEYVRRVVEQNVSVFAMEDGEGQRRRDEGLRMKMSVATKARVERVGAEDGDVGDGGGGEQVDKTPSDGSASGKVEEYGTDKRLKIIEDYDAFEEARKGWLASASNL